MDYRVRLSFFSCKVKTELRITLLIYHSQDILFSGLNREIYFDGCSSIIACFDSLVVKNAIFV